MKRRALPIAARRGWLAAGALGLLLFTGAAALAQQDDADDPDAPKWQEDAAPPPPAYSVDGLVDIELPGARSRAVKIGIAPQTIQINQKTGVVRYVIVMRGSSAVNASYEGIRCDTAEYRVYARQTAGQPWETVKAGTWQPMRGDRSAPYPLLLARGGVCLGTTVNVSPEAIVHALQSGRGVNDGQG